MRKKNAAAVWILIAMVAGIAIGYMVFTSFPDKKAAAEVAGYISLVSDVFLRLIKMVIGPLVFSTLVVGIAHMGDARRSDACSRNRSPGSSPRRWFRCCSGC
ncbi:putative sodium:dicarboxylate symporter family protein [Burkholderia cenocepacia]|nr:putative sodium:dicarboxylate symporter family protein [Burkholderia cenocepacia]